MNVYLRFADLKARGIVRSRPSLRYRIEHFGFPPGRLIGANTRAWTESEIEAWIASRPTAPKPAPQPKHRPGRPRKLIEGAPS